MLPVGIIALGLVQGALAGLNSLGLVLLWRTTRVVNLAQPRMGVVGGVLTGVLIEAAGWNFWWAVPVGMLVGGLLALGTDRIFLRKLSDAPRAVVLVATIGLGGVFAAIQTAIPFVFTGVALPTYHIKIGMTLDLFPARLLGGDILVLMIFPIAVVGLLAFLYRTRFGLAALAL